MYFRNNKEEANASRILEAVLKDNPAHPWAASVQIQMLVAANKLEEAKRVVSAALDSSPDKAKVPVAFFLLNAAVENSMPPVADSLKRALAAVEQGLSSQPASVELVQAKCRLLGLMGDQKGAIAFVDAKAKTDPKGPFTRVLLNLYREIRDYRAAERVAADLLKVSPNDGALAVSLVRLVASQSIEARGRGDRAAVESLNARTASLIRDFRARFPADPAFVQLECELAVRRGEPGRAVSLSQEYDKMAPGSPSGPLMRAAIYASQGRARDVAAAYTEALERNPRQGEVRLMLAQVDLRLGDFDQAVRQASLILEADPDQPAAMLVQAKALASTTGSASQASAGRARAIDVLNEAIRKSPKFSDAYHALAEIHLNNGSTDQAIAALRQGLKAVPDDANGLSIAIRILCEPPAPGKTADPARLDEARAIAEEFAGKDEKGGLALAVAVGFHRSAQLLNALPWAEKAVKLSDTRPVHLNFGDLLLSLAESTRGDGRTEYLSRALAEFDRVLKEQPDNIEAVNNKAWILHSYQNRSQEALELAEGLVRRAEPAMLPAEFYDTLGSIRETIGRSREAEEAYRKGLEKAPDMPIINFHMGRLIASDPSRAKKAAPFLEKAIAGRASLPPEQAAEASSLSEKVKR
jgi:cellulose synthase operon protein C